MGRGYTDKVDENGKRALEQDVVPYNQVVGPREGVSLLNLLDKAVQGLKMGLATPRSQVSESADLITMSKNIIYSFPHEFSGGQCYLCAR